jgi:2-dehydro-3-deoxyphosphooctonate aldolase (KDO 8-P synthase)
LAGWIYSDIDKKPLFIAGPCVIESIEHCLKMAVQIKKYSEKLDVVIVFKASFDKANRTAVKSYRGPGLKKGLEILAAVKKETGFKILTDVHETAQVEQVAEVVDVIQVPAFLCRQTDLLLECAKSGKTVNVKKGQFLSPWDMKYVVEKLEHGKAKEIWLTERGASFGYNNLVVDMRSIPVMKEFGYPVIFDATHSVQRPGGGAGRSSGDAGFIMALAQAAAGAGADGFFFEVHDNPAKALSDGANSLKIPEFPAVAKKLSDIFKIVRK